MRLDVPSSRLFPELRAQSGIGILTALARLGGRPAGVLASNPRHLGGAIDADAADKATTFLRLCQAHRLPVVSLSDDRYEELVAEYYTRARP